MPEQIILIIRHAEKPEPGGDGGVDPAGNPDPKSLTSRGWQRAGAWTELFVPSLDRPSALPKPTVLFASAPAGHKQGASGNDASKSRRPLETITPLAAKLEIAIDLQFSRGDEAELAESLSGTDGVVLVCWQHENIATIAGGLDPVPEGVPQLWPSDRFNVIFQFQRSDIGSAWTFQQVIPVMLAGDSQSNI